MKKYILFFVITTYSFLIQSQVTTINFNYTGSSQNFVVPPCVTTISVTVAGGKGGGVGGTGAIINATLSVTPGQILQINVGGQGNCPTAGWNGGGNGGAQSPYPGQTLACGGGGASDIRIAPYGLANRIVVAGGGGGSGGGDNFTAAGIIGGNAGCPNGSNGTNSYGAGGGGGTTTSGGTGGAPWAGVSQPGSPGSLGQGGKGGDDLATIYAAGGGGGGGLYGGGGGGADGCCIGANGGGAGGGGSSLIPPGGSCSVGNNGNGYVIIKYAAAMPTAVINSTSTCSGNPAILSSTVSPSGGTYNWQPGGYTTPNITVTPASNTTYTLIYSTGGCTTSAIGTVSISPSPTISTTVKNVSCYGVNDGSISISTSGGSPPYSYTWMPSVSSSSSATGLAAGNYTISVANSNNCITSTVVTITQPSALSLTVTQTQSISCNGGNNGIASANVSGGSPAYSYTWLPSGGNTSTATNLSAGIYTVNIKDANNCTINSTVQISQPPALSLTATQTQSISCNGGNNGSANASVSGGMPAYSYTWLPSGGNSANATNLTAGIYTINVKDANNCSISNTVQITQPPALSLTASQTQSISCNSGNNGSANASVSGGMPAYSYTWLPSGGNSANATNLTAGIYTVIVADANNCSINSTVQISQPPALSLSILTQSASCSTPGSATANVSGGVGGYSYTWTPTGGNNNIATGLGAGNYTVAILDANNCSITGVANITSAPMVSIASVNTNSVSCNGGSNGSATVNVGGGATPYSYTWTPSVSSNSFATGLAAGTYSIFVKDNNNCTTNTVITISQPPALSLTANQTQSISCNGGNNGSAAANPSGGVGGYSYTWSPSGGNSTTANNLSAGIYTVDVTDANNCTISQTVQIIQPPALSLTATQTQSVSCNGGNNGSANASVSGGMPAYSYTWLPSGGNSASATTLTAGIYTVIVADANNCSINSTVQISQPPALSLSILTQSASCSTPGSATANVSGGVGGYSYTWTPTGGNNNIATGLGAGNYTITISDANNCSITGVANITGAPMVSIASVNTNSVSCNGGSNGSATVNVSGGATPYSYTWAPSVSSNSFATGLAAGTYSIFVKDNNNCTTNTVITISQPPALSLTANQTQSISCNGGNNGSAAANPNGGVGGYSYTWSPSGSNSATANNLSAGIYTVDVTDANNCSISQTVQIIQPPALSLTATQTQSVSCNSGNNGSANASVSGGMPAYSYTWLPSGGNSASANNLSASIYTITISDANACGPLSATVQIDQPPALSITAGGQNASCFGYSNGSATVNATGGVGGYSYTWTPSGGNSNTASGLIAGVYTISVTDANACPVSTIITISQPSSINLITSPNPTICFGNSTNIQATGSGGTAPYSYTWNPNISTNGGPVLVSPTITTQYQVSISDANNCSGPSSIITVYVKPPLSASGFTASVCDNNSVMLYPSITSPGNGGPYSYLWSNGASSPSVTITGNSALGSMNSYSVIIDDGCSNPPAIANFSVFIYPNPDISFSADITNGCAPLLTNFTANSNTVSISSYTWIFGNGSSSNSNPAATNYTTPGIFSPTLIAQSQFGCISQTIIPNYIQAYPSPIADFSADTWTVNLYEPTVNFFNLSSGANNYQWNFGDPMSGNLNSSSLSNPSHEYLYAGNFIVTLIVKNQYGCTDYIAKTIYVEPVFHLYIPNVFTPDGNGINDVFQPKGIGIDESDYLMLIFDRWGEKIFESNNFLKGWDGSIKGNDGKVKQDVYVYKIYVKDIKGNKHEFVGHVTCLPYTKE